MLAKFGMRRKQNFDIVFGFKSSTTLSTFTFRFLSFPLFSLSLPHFIILLLFFQLAGHLVGFILVGRVSEKPFIILELGAQKGRWVMEQAFHGDFQVSVTLVLLAVSPVSLTELCSFWYSLRDLFSLHKLVDKAVPDR